MGKFVRSKISEDEAIMVHDHHTRIGISDPVAMQLARIFSIFAILWPFLNHYEYLSNSILMPSRTESLAFQVQNDH